DLPCVEFGALPCLVCGDSVRSVHGRLLRVLAGFGSRDHWNILGFVGSSTLMYDRALFGTVPFAFATTHE
ncbi:MAG TPA: hypothetical protein VFY54_03070, partial [Rubrobacter sp.]|nr:hypothetical protein [Rubrobacter sp.]